MQPSGECGEEVRSILVRAEMRPAVRSNYELLDTLPLQVLSFPNELVRSPLWIGTGARAPKTVMDIFSGHDTRRRFLLDLSFATLNID